MSSSTSSFSSNTRSHKIKHPAVVDLNCSCTCGQRRSNLLFSLFSKSKPTPGKLSSSSDDAMNSSFRKRREEKKKKKKKAVAEEGIAVVKESTEPYVDFRESMVQMIVEEELYTWHDLDGLVHRLLSLNSLEHHHLILGAFVDICDGVFSACNERC